MGIDFFDDFTKHQGSWTPPVYPELDSPNWNKAFKKATAEGRKDIANLWCWRMQVRLENTVMREHLDLVVPHYKWLRTIKPYVSHALFGEKSPFDVLQVTIKSKFVGQLNPEDADTCIKHFETLWFGHPCERLETVKLLGALFGPYCDKSMKPAGSVLRLAHNLVWDAINESTEENLYALIGATRISVLCGLAEVVFPRALKDPRAKAWHALACAVRYPEARNNIKNAAVAHETIKAMPILAAIDGITMLVRDCNRRGMLNQDKFNMMTVLNPDQTKFDYDVWDVYKHWVPSRKALWETARALDMSIIEAVEQIHNEVKTESTVDVPSDFSGGHETI